MTRAVTRVRIALAGGLLSIAGAVAVALAHAPLVVAGKSAGFTHHVLVATATPASACQHGEALPAGTSAIRLGMTADVGPQVKVKVWSGSRLVAEGTREPGWLGASVVVGLRRAVARAAAPVRVCSSVEEMNGPVEMLGTPTRRAIAATDEGRPLPGRMHVEYLRPGRKSWWSLAPGTARRLGLGRAGAGTWNAVLVALLATMLVALPSWLVVRELR